MAWVNWREECSIPLLFEQKVLDMEGAGKNGTDDYIQ